MEITLQSQITLHPLTIKKDRKNFIVEEPISGDFFEMPEICIEAIQQIMKGETLVNIEKHLINKYTEEDVDLIGFLHQLFDLKLIKTIDGKELSNQNIKDLKETGEFRWIPAKVGRFFFNRFSNKLYFTLTIANILMIIFNSEFIPHYRDVFIFEDAVTFNILIYMGVTLILLNIHEMGHVLAGRSYDLPSKLSIGNRLIFIVLETDLTQGWKLKPKQRNILFLAGMCFEQVILFFSLLLLIFSPIQNIIFIGILKIVVLYILVTTVYQFSFYMKTDIYYLVENITGNYNLMENAKQHLRKWFPFIKNDSTTETFDGEEGAVKIYSLFLVSGVCLTFLVFGLYFIPQTVVGIKTSIYHLSHSFGTIYFWDGLVFMIQLLVIIGLLLFVNKKKQKE